MASIFLSYGRDDERRARLVAALLDRTGHKVWWDRQIKGGHEFGTEIEAALNDADKIVVLWSQESVKSPWVRDEAAVGRDTGRLVPATIDGTSPPLGFRQFQTIDLSRWNGRERSHDVESLLSAVETSGPSYATVADGARKRVAPKPSRNVVFGLGAAVGIAGVVALAWQLWPSGETDPPTFVVLSANDSSSKKLASEIGTRIASLDDPSGARFRVLDADAGQRANGYALKVATGALSLISSRDDAVMWSTPLDVGQGSRDDFAQAASITAQRVLSCAADALSFRQEKINQQTLKLYLSGCTRYDAAYGSNSPNTSLKQLFQEVIHQAPHFAPAWSKLFAVESEDLAGVNPGHEALARDVRTQLKRASQLGIDVPEVYAAKANLLSPADFLGIFRAFDEGISRHPDSAFLFRLRGERNSYVGRMNDAVADTAQALQLNPLSQANQQSYASELAYSGNIDAAYAQLRKAERLWPNSMAIGMARYRMDLRFGDPREAQQLYLKYAILGQNPAQAKFIEARINPTLQNIEAALEPARTLNRQFPPFIADLIQSYGQFGRKDEAIDLLIEYPGGRWREWIGYNSEVLFRPAMRDVWRDPRSIAGAANVGLLHYWKVSGRWPDFCFDPTLPYDCKKEAAKYPS